MPAVCCGLKSSWDCKSQVQSDVFDPKANGNLSTMTIKRERLRSSRYTLNFKDIMSDTEKPTGCSTKSLGSSEFCSKGKDREKDGPMFLGKVSPETTDNRGHNLVHHYRPIETHGGSIIFYGGGSSDIPSRTSIETDCYCSSNLICQICGEKLRKLDAIQAQHLSKPSVIELGEGDSSRKIVEMICQKSWFKSENSCRKIERVLKVQNTQKTITLFEEYREKVKSEASKQIKTHPRCLVDGNELLRFYGTTFVCSLGMNGSSSLCTLDNCGVCQVLRHGYFTKKEFNGGLGVFTTSTSKRAFQSIELYEEDQSLRKALILCRVVAGSVHRLLDRTQELSSPEFDSLDGTMGCHSNIGELYVLNPVAILPCFVVIYKPWLRRDYAKSKTRSAHTHARPYTHVFSCFLRV